MPNFRRHWIENQIHFQTHVTYKRMPILIDNFEYLWRAIQNMRHDTNFELIAWAVLPDHFHLMINAGYNDPSDLIKRIKLSFSSRYRKKSHLKYGRVWQHRFWNHVIMNQIDLNNHIDYIHYNAVKHGYVKDPFEYKYSSLDEYFRQGLYSRDWGIIESRFFNDSYGE